MNNTKTDEAYNSLTAAIDWHLNSNDLSTAELLIKTVDYLLNIRRNRLRISIAEDKIKYYKSLGTTPFYHNLFTVMLQTTLFIFTAIIISLLQQWLIRKTINLTKGLSKWAYDVLQPFIIVSICCQLILSLIVFIIALSYILKL